MKISTIGFVIKHHHQQALSLAHDLMVLALQEVTSDKKLVTTRHKLHFMIAVEKATDEATDSLTLTAKKIIKTKDFDSKKFLKQNSSLSKNVTFSFVPHQKLPERCDLVVVLGGDGTFLSIARYMQKTSIPILGINMGTVGYLTEINAQDAKTVFKNIIKAKKIPFYERRMLRVELKRKNKILFDGPIVNDAVISKGAIARMITTEVLFNQKHVNTLRADGVIISTPTGSTAYNLAAGGPIIDPAVPAMIITPICPHSLTQRPLVIQDTTHVKLCLSHQPGQVMLALDGQEGFEMLEGDEVSISLFTKHGLKIASNTPSLGHSSRHSTNAKKTNPTERDYMDLLKEKLNFGVIKNA